MILKLAIILVGLSLVTTSMASLASTATDTFSDCQQSLEVDFLRDHIRQVRDEYKLASGSVSLALGGEHQVIKRSGANDDHVLSLGSGPDLFRPLYDFPTAGHIHLVDTFDGWGGSEDVVRTEIQSRLKALSNLAAPELVQSTSTDQVWLVRWGYLNHTRSTYIHLNQMDYDNPMLVRRLLAQMPSQKVFAIFTSGAPLPKTKTLKIFLGSLTPRSLFIASSYRLRPPRIFTKYIPFGLIQRLYSGEHSCLDLRMKGAGRQVTELLDRDNNMRGLFAQYAYVYETRAEDNSAVRSTLRASETAADYRARK